MRGDTIFNSDHGLQYISEEFTEEKVLSARDPSIPELLADGWRIAHRSWAAQLDADKIDRAALERLVVTATRDGALHIRPVTDRDVPAVLDLDGLTINDYLGGVATRHAALTPKPLPTPLRVGWGIFDRGDPAPILAVTYLDLMPGDDPKCTPVAAEVDFTVVHPDFRHQGLASGVKAMSVLALMEAGVQTFRTGGAVENVGILAANRALGFVRDEEWVTLER